MQQLLPQGGYLLILNIAPELVYQDNQIAAAVFAECVFLHGAKQGADLSRDIGRGHEIIELRRSGVRSQLAHRRGVPAGVSGKMLGILTNGVTKSSSYIVAAIPKPGLWVKFFGIIRFGKESGLV